jgi:hypothetical protein
MDGRHVLRLVRLQCLHVDPSSEDPMTKEDEAKLEAFIRASHVLADWVLKNIDDCNEPRAYAYSVLRWKDRFEATQEGKQCVPKLD